MGTKLIVESYRWSEILKSDVGSILVKTNKKKALGKSVSLLRAYIYIYTIFMIIMISVRVIKMQVEVHLNFIKYIFGKVQYKDLLKLFGKLNLFVKDDK